MVTVFSGNIRGKLNIQLDLIEIYTETAVVEQWYRIASWWLIRGLANYSSPPWPFHILHISIFWLSSLYDEGFSFFLIKSDD